MSASASTAFISYSREDSEFALRLAQDLKAAGANIWLDQLDIEPGLPWDNAIEDALTDAPQMLIVLSPASARSNNVRNEISFALEQGKIVVPVLYMDCVVPLRLQRTQRIDFRADYARGLAALLAHLRVNQPNQDVLQKAAEADAHRQAAWKAREAQATRLKELEDQRVREDAEAHDQQAEQTRLKEAAALEARNREAEAARLAEAARVAEAQRQAQLKAAEEKRARELQNNTNPDPVPPPLPWWQSTPVILSSVIVVLILILGYVLLRPSPTPKDNTVTTLQPQPVTPAPANPTPANTTPAAPDPASPTPASTTPSNPAPANTSSINDASSQWFTIPSTKSSPALKAKSTLIPAASSAEADSLYKQGVAADNRKDDKSAAPLFEQACDLGKARSCTFLGYLYDNGSGVQKSQSKAVALYKKGCDGNDPTGCSNLGLDYKNGTGVTKNMQTAVTLFRKGCDGDNADSCQHLGFLYDTGTGGMSSNKQEAARLYQKACDGGNYESCKNLGIEYAEGTGVTKNLQTAASLYQKACTGGDSDGCRNIGNLYETGGIGTNLAKAKESYQRACTLGDKVSCDALKTPKFQ